jgi:predicted nucleotidyltransferase
MNDHQQSPTSDEARELARRVAERFQPDKIILFGSLAAGYAESGSDIDLLVVMDCPYRPVEQAVAIRRFLDYARPLDVIVRTPAELERRLALGDWFLREVMEQGIVLYERPQP